MDFINEVYDINKRLGQVGKNREGDQMVITKYNTYDDVIVTFPSTNCHVHTQYINFIKGYVKNNKKVKHGLHGYIGNGKYRAEYIDDNGQRHNYPAYNMWRQMHERAENFDNKHPSYADVTICKEWWDYQQFAEWVEENYYTVGDEIICLDKDIIKPYSRIYSPETCCIIPNKINEVFKTGKKKFDGLEELPVGITIRKDGKNKKYRARVNVYDEYYNIVTLSKTASTIEEAFEFYKAHKEKYIKEIAEEYKDLIPDNIYKALINYKVERKISC